MASGSRSNRKLVPESSLVIDQWKYEIAAELGLPVGYTAAGGADAEFASELGAVNGGGQKDYWGHISSRDADAVGGHITKRLIEQAQKQLFQL